MPDVEIPVETPAPEAEPQIEEQEPESPPAYLSPDHVFPESDDIPEPLRGKKLGEALRVFEQQRTEASSANAANRQLHEQQLEVARELLASRRGSSQQQQRPQQPTEPILYRAGTDESGNAVAVPVPLSELRSLLIGPLQQQLEEVHTNTFIHDSEAARIAARPPDIPPDVWDELRPELGMFMGVRSMDTRVKQSWTAAINGVRQRLGKLGIRTAAAPPPVAPNSPVGNATSLPAPQSKNGMPRLSAADQRELDEVAQITGMKKGSPTYIKAAKSIAAGYNEGNR